MRKIVSREEAQREPWYGSIRILTDGRVRFSAEPGAIPAVRFSARRYRREEDGRWVYDSGRYVIAARRNGLHVLLLFVRRSRLRSACFSYVLDPLTLRKGVADFLKAGNGIERWLAPALEHTQWSLTQSGTNPALLKAIPRVLRSLEGVPRVDRRGKTGKRPPSKKAAKKTR